MADMVEMALRVGLEKVGLQEHDGEQAELAEHGEGQGNTYHRRGDSLRSQLKRQIISCAVGMCILLVSFATVFILQQEDVQRKYIYPFEYRTVIEEYSGRYEVSPYLVAAVIKTESKFRHNATSDTGAMGLMQLMPETAGWIAWQLDDEAYDGANLSEPERNIRYGTWYLSVLQDEFRGNEVLALAAYNAGWGNVQEWMEKYGWDYSFQDIEAIPFRETEEYVKSVLRNQEKYRQLYGALKND